MTEKQKDLKSVGWIRKSLTFTRTTIKNLPGRNRLAPIGVQLRPQPLEISTSSAFKSFLGTSLKQIFQTLSLLASDAVCFLLAFGTAILLRVKVFPLFYGGFPSGLYFSDLPYLWWTFLLWVFLLFYEGLYSRRTTLADEVLLGWKATFLSALGSTTLIFFIKPEGLDSRMVLLVAWFNILWLFPLTRYFGKRLLIKLGIWKTKVLVLGVGEGSQPLLKSLTSEKTLGYEVVGFLNGTSAPFEIPEISYNGIKAPLLGNVRETQELMHRLKVNDIIVDLRDSTERQAYIGILTELQKKANSVLIVPDFQDLPILGSQLEFLFNNRFFLLRVPSNLAKPWKHFVKSSFDFISGILIFLAICPLLLLIALAIKIDSKGPVIYTQTRIGRKGKRFKFYKFRTMVENADEVLKEYLEKYPQAQQEWITYSKFKNDPRLTRIGKFLRKTSLDELPQIFNVLKGEMSLVGPRPLIEEEIEKYGEDIDSYHFMRPGITGLSQVSGRCDITFKERIAGDLWYLNNWSLWLELLILFRTVKVVLQKQGAY